MGFLPMAAGIRRMQRGLLTATRRSSNLNRNNVRPLLRQPYYAAHFSSTLYPFAMKEKIGLGGNNWSQMDPGIYESIIEKALSNGLTMMESGQEGGDQALLNAILLEQDKLREDSEPITMTLRIGYRTITPVSRDAEDDQKRDKPERFVEDVPVEQHPFLGPNRTNAPLEDEDLSSSPPPKEESEEDKVIQILHNISGTYIESELKKSKLVEHFQKDPKPFRIVPLLHNPEAQIMAMESENITKVPIENRQEFLKNRLADSFFTLEKAVAEGKISSYGVASNGLILPSEHPLHLSTGALLGAALNAMERAEKEPWYKPSEWCHLSVIQLPVNLMERTGLDVAKELREKIDDTEQYQHLRQTLEIYAMRPLTCYPDRGTGTGHPFRLVDYKLPSGPSQLEQAGIDKGEVPDEKITSKQWTHEMEGPPLIYPMALKKAMAHFDAEEILKAKMERELTSEERETLDGCKLLQSMLHDLDAGLPKVRSLGAHEQDLSERIIPLIHDTFEGYDEETADVLQMFFRAYSLAVRYHIAKNTRMLLKKGGDDGRSYKYKDIPDGEKLQDYALEYLLKESAISKVVVGATKPEQIVDMVNLCSRLDAELEEKEKKTDNNKENEKEIIEPEPEKKQH